MANKNPHPLTNAERAKGGRNKPDVNIREITKRIISFIDSDITIPALIAEVFKDDPKAILAYLSKVAPKELDIGGQKDNPVILMTPEEKAIAEGKDVDTEKDS
jgi:hypothetical protein